MTIGFIVNDIHPCLQTIESYEIDQYVFTGKPILIVGFKEAVELYPSASLADKALDEKKRIYYSFSKEESEVKYKENLNNFITHCFEIIAKKYKVINITSVTGLKIDFKQVFIHETPTAITITGLNKILYINKEIASFFNKVPLTVPLLLEMLKDSRIVSWDHHEFFGAHLKASNCYKSKEQVMTLFAPFGDIDLYMGAVCLSMLRDLPLYRHNPVEVWQRAYCVETMLSKIPIKINVERVKELAADEDNAIMQNIYKASENGYVHQKVNGTDKVTGRLFPHASGFSLQSLSKNFRDIVVAEPNCILLEFDYDFFEYSLMAQSCKIQLTGDPHLHLSQLLFEDDLHRAIGKQINYSLLYGKSIEGIIDETSQHPDLKITKESLRIKLIEITAPIQNFQKKLELELKTNGFIQNAFGRNIYPDSKYLCLNYFLQSTAADILILKLIKLTELLSHYDCLNKIVLQNHDSILLNLSLDAIDATEIANEIKEMLELPENGLGSKVDTKYGLNWRQLS